MRARSTLASARRSKCRGKPGVGVEETRMPERIVVVGHAAVTCLGRDMDATWGGLIAGRSGIRRHGSFGPDQYLQDVAGIVEDFGPGTASEDPAVARLEARAIHLAMAAARGAWADASLVGAGYDPDR